MPLAKVCQGGKTISRRKCYRLIMHAFVRVRSDANFPSSPKRSNFKVHIATRYCHYNICRTYIGNRHRRSRLCRTQNLNANHDVICKTILMSMCTKWGTKSQAGAFRQLLNPMLCLFHTADTDKTRRRHGQDKTVLSCPCRRCKLNWRQVKTVFSSPQ